MARVPDIVPISDLRQDAAGIIRRLRSSNTPVVITQRGRASAVIQSAEAYERTQQELEILKILARGEVEIDAGVGNEVRAVFDRADRLLASGE